MTPSRLQAPTKLGTLLHAAIAIGALLALTPFVLAFTSKPALPRRASEGDLDNQISHHHQQQRAGNLQERESRLPDHRPSLQLVSIAAPSHSSESLDQDDWYDSQRGAGQPMSAQEAADSMQRPAGFQVQVVAAEPLIQNPIAMDWDDRGRLWIAENGTYSEHGVRFDLQLSDRIKLLIDNDGDGVADDCRLFANDLKRLTSFATDHDGLWVLCPPQLLFLPDRDRDDVIDGPAEVKLDGFTVPPESYHTIANGLRFGLDGWLYGRVGASSPGWIRRPDQPEQKAVPIAGGIWRFHPQRGTFETVCHGTTNPWGHDWNSLGELFFVNTVNGHLWHGIPGAHFQRPHSASPNPLVYQAIDTHADHYHWDTSEPWTASRGGGGIHDPTGGGHAHCGTTIYQGGLWPDAFHDKLLTLNFHGRRVNCDRLERVGSGYVGRHEPDPFRMQDPWFRGLDLRYGPDGNVVVIDWSDTGECHEHDGVHRSSGRIYRLVYTEANSSPATPIDWQPQTGFATLSLQSLELALNHSNQWWVRQARRELERRAFIAHSQTLSQPTAPSSVEQLQALQQFTLKQAGLLQSERTAAQQVSTLLTVSILVQALNDASPLEPNWLISQLTSTHEAVRTQAVNLLVDDLPIDSVLGNYRGTDAESEALVRALVELAANETSARVRLALASALQKLSLESRLSLAKQLVDDRENIADHNLPAMIWFGLIPIAKPAPERLLELLPHTQAPELRRWMARRCGEVASQQGDLLQSLFLLALNSSDELRYDVVLGLSQGLVGTRRVQRPDAWEAFRKLTEQSLSADPSDLRSVTLAIDLIEGVFGEGQSLERLAQTVRDRQVPLALREASLRTLIDVQAENLEQVCRDVIRERYLNRTALVGLTRFDDREIGLQIANDYRSFHLLDRPAVIDSLVTRSSFCEALIIAMERGRIPAEAVQVRHVQAIAKQVDPAMLLRLEEVWGSLRLEPTVKDERIAELKEMLTSSSLEPDLGRGRTWFDRRCANCHRMFGSGSETAPELTGSDRRNLEYLLSNIVDPSAVVPRDFRMTLVETNDGRTLSGLVVAENESSVTLLGVSTRDTIDKSAITARVASDQSLMPEGLLDDLDEQSLVDFIAYLRSEHQVAPVDTDGESTDSNRERLTP